MKVVESYLSLSLEANLNFPFLVPAQGRQEEYWPAPRCCICACMGFLVELKARNKVHIRPRWAILRWWSARCCRVRRKRSGTVYSARIWSHGTWSTLLRYLSSVDTQGPFVVLLFLTWPWPQPFYVRVSVSGAFHGPLVCPCSRGVVASIGALCTLCARTHNLIWEIRDSASWHILKPGTFPCVMVNKCSLFCFRMVGTSLTSWRPLARMVTVVEDTRNWLQGITLEVRKNTRRSLCALYKHNPV